MLGYAQINAQSIIRNTIKSRGGGNLIYSVHSERGSQVG
jgi:hypothetical protein